MPRRAGASGKDWPRYAVALDMRLAGAKFNEIARHLGVSQQRAQQMCKLAAAQLAFRVFRGVPRPLPRTPWLERRPEPIRTLRPSSWGGPGA